MPQRVPGRVLRARLIEALAGGGFVAPEEEADELLAAAPGDPARVEALLARRLTGEPLAWITGSTTFCDVVVRVDPGVYVPRWQSEPLARRAAERLPPDGTAVDVCTGSGAVAMVLAAACPRARVLGTELDATAATCAERNGVEVLRGDLLDAVPAALDGAVDVVCGVVPYVPTPELGLLQRDTLAFEAPVAYDGGADGLALARRVVRDAPRLLRPGGALLLELGGTQDAALAVDLATAGFVGVREVLDEDGDLRGVEAARPT